MQLSGSEYMTRLISSWSTKLRWAVHLAFLFDSEELTRSGAQAGGAEEDEPQATTAAVVPWRDSLARWSLAGLFRHLGFNNNGQVMGVGGEHDGQVMEGEDTTRAHNHVCPK